MWGSFAGGVENCVGVEGKCGDRCREVYGMSVGKYVGARGEVRRDVEV